MQSPIEVKKSRQEDFFLKDRESRVRRKQKPVTDTTVCVIGLGYVGLPLSLAAARKGYIVNGYDIDHDRIARIAARQATEVSKDEQRDVHLNVSTSEKILSGMDVYIICVPTPVLEDHEPDLEPLKSAAKVVSRHLSPGALVIVESTVSPGVCEKVVLPILEKATGLSAEEDFSFAHCPERINPGDENWDVSSIPRVLAGSGTESLAHVKAFYESVLDAPVHSMASIQEAEAVKMVENAFRDVNIAFVNELAMSFSKSGIDLVNVLTGASTKPFGFVPFSPGCGVGGHCIPVDPYYLIRYGKENGFHHRFLIIAREINSKMPAYTVSLLKEALEARGKTLFGSNIALLGLSYKANVGDLRESPALDILSLLLRAEAFVDVYDPYVEDMSTVASMEEALTNADAVVLATGHDDFAVVSPQLLKQYGISIVIDGRNHLPKEEFEKAGILYRGIGR